MMNKPHALVVGGTGMLKPVSLHLARQGYHVSVVARTSERLNALAEEAKAFEGSINPITVDYHEIGAFADVLRQATECYGRIELAIVWIHKTAPEAYYVMAQFVGAPEKPGRYIHLVGSATGDPANAQAVAERRERFARLQNIMYQEVILGFIIEKDKTSRWLKQEEIQQGTRYAIDHPEVHQHIVGTLTPWSAKPTH
jgi:NAD(P)-dependent dehydrogenase (short-subunit alcohol dehydrogenase family)